ncbi:Flp pilus assembly protein CpaB [Robbsia sp. Bb-Pol-6]|uniref:Flp pilus assembly protein CpaB n=1 Tax=Robbsia betulipollinis TaxID=2981849 RepID=A0ABT3ZSG4_9BURK|nr:Flp pilus assembly protein CpaB [Robbsia betulipollinis]MCY0389489.1 Flp pilus assembly protein CpaB [Robbsia betulipollinis]
MSNIIKFAFLIVGAILLALIVRTVVSKTTESTARPVDTVKVRISAADLPQGLLLRDDDLRWQAVPTGKVPAGAIVANTPNAVEIKGALLRHPVTAGTVFLADDVILPSAPGFLAATLKPDMRAVSVAVDDVSGNAGLIEPGDYVDLLLTQMLEHQNDTSGHSVASETVVEHVRVLASGSEILRPKTGDASDTRQRARTVTLEVTPRMSEVIAVAARLGSLSLALRSFATASRDPYALAGAASGNAASATLPPPVWSKDISRALNDMPAPRAVHITAAVAPPAPRTVTIYRGSEKSDTTAGSGSQSGNGSGNGSGSGSGSITGGVPPLPPAVAMAR